MALRNLLSKTIILKRGTVVAQVMAANEMLTPKIIVETSTVNVHLSVHPSTGVEIGKEHAHPDRQ